MNDKYEDLIKSVSTQIAEIVLSRESGLMKETLTLDSKISKILRQIGKEATHDVYERLLAGQVELHQSEGLKIHRQPKIEFTVVFGQIELLSPYLWKPGVHCKPLKEAMGITHQGRSETVNRALSDFGIEESFRQAAKRFSEHYHFDVSPSTVLRETERKAEEAFNYVTNRFNQIEEEASVCEDHSDVDVVLAELDACKIRTGQLQAVEESSEQLSADGDVKKKKHIQWRDVRIGLTRPLDQKSKLYVGQIADYPQIINQLRQASISIGMDAETEVVAVADGGIGLKEELERQFPNLQFILDKTHLKDHLYDTAEELGVVREERKQWVKPRLEKISRGQVKDVVKELEDQYVANPHKRLKQLLGYIHRFMNAIHYNDFKKRDYPIGSGEVESAHRYVPQKRLKLPGASWHPDSINPMLAMRVIRANEWWEDFWEQTTKKVNLN
ncbi:MAG: hypothetical protein GY861_04335 [bacterium]|nr:hypothetical protein [bacterium]